MKVGHVQKPIKPTVHWPGVLLRTGKMQKSGKRHAERLFMSQHQVPLYDALQLVLGIVQTTGKLLQGRGVHSRRFEEGDADTNLDTDTCKHLGRRSRFHGVRGGITAGDPLSLDHGRWPRPVKIVPTIMAARMRRLRLEPVCFRYHRQA